MSSVSPVMELDGPSPVTGSPLDNGSPARTDSVVAAFDVDKTLTERDCVVPFLLRLFSWRAAARCLRFGLPMAWAGVQRDRDRMKALATRAVMTGLERHHVDRMGREFAAEIVATWMRPDTNQRLQWHRQQGHHIVLVSASYGGYLRHLGAHLGCTEVLSCEVAFDDLGRCTGELIDGNCRGAEKERRLKLWMSQQGLDNAAVYAYGDSSGDDQLLAMATWPTRVGASLLSASPLSPVDDVMDLAESSENSEGRHS